MNMNTSIPSSVPVRVLIAEDSAAVRNQLVDVISQLPGVETFVACDGVRALSMVKEKQPALLVTDNEMPGMSGLQLLRVLRATYTRFELPVLMLTVQNATHTKVLAFEHGANDYVTKPVEPAELKARVASQLELKRAVEQNIQARIQLVEGRRYQAVGRLAAGVAHELNNPAQAVSSHLSFLRQASSALHEVLRSVAPWAQGASPDLRQLGIALQADWKRLGVQELLQEVPLAADDALEGVQRMAGIIRELTDFAGNPDLGTEKLNVNRALTNTVQVARRTGSIEMDVEVALAQQLPAIDGSDHALKQAFLGLLTNASEAAAQVKNGWVRVTSEACAGGVQVSFSDNGPGIPLDLQSEIYDPFFSTKPVGQGSGQGLFLAQTIVVQQHQGTLRCESKPQQGARFVVWLPGCHS